MIHRSFLTSGFRRFAGIGRLPVAQGMPPSSPCAFSWRELQTMGWKVIGIEKMLARLFSLCRGPRLKLRRDVDFVIQVIRVLVPDHVMHLEWIARPFSHNGVTGETIDNASTESDIPMPGCGRRRLAIFVFRQGANIRVRGRFEISNVRGRVNPFVYSEVKSWFVRRDIRCCELSFGRLGQVNRFINWHVCLLFITIGSFLFSLILLPAGGNRVNKQCGGLVCSEIRLAPLNSPCSQFRRTLHIAIHMEGLIIPNNAVDFQGVLSRMFHELIKGGSRHGVPTQGEVSMPVGGRRLAAINILLLVTTFNICRMFILMRDDERWGNPFLDSEIKDMIGRGRSRGNDLRNCGGGLFGHGRKRTGHFVQEIREKRKTDRTYVKFLEL
jgi:hypothetical protein